VILCSSRADSLKCQRRTTDPLCSGAARSSNIAAILSPEPFNEKVAVRRWSRADTCNQVQAIPNHRNTTVRVEDFGMFVCSRPCLLRKFLFVFSSFGIILAIANGY
jgi:hypothetical protein